MLFVENPSVLAAGKNKPFDTTVELFGIKPGAVTAPVNDGVDAVVTIVPLVVGKVSVVVPATAGACRVTAPEVSPLITMLAMSFPYLLQNHPA